MKTTAVMTQRKVGEDDVLKGVPIAKIQFYKKKLLTVINGSYGKCKKWREKFTQTLNCHVLWKEGSYKRSVIREKIRMPEDNVEK